MDHRHQQYQHEEQLQHEQEQEQCCSWMIEVLQQTPSPGEESSSMDFGSPSTGSTEREHMFLEFGQSFPGLNNPISHQQFQATEIHHHRPRCFEHGCAFSSVDNYRRHLREQEKMSTATCQLCGAVFSRKSNRDKHVARKTCMRTQSGGFYNDSQVQQLQQCMDTTEFNWQCTDFNEAFTSVASNDTRNDYELAWGPRRTLPS